MAEFQKTQTRLHELHSSRNNISRACVGFSRCPNNDSGGGGEKIYTAVIETKSRASAVAIPYTRIYILYLFAVTYSDVCGERVKKARRDDLKI